MIWDVLKSLKRSPLVVAKHSLGSMLAHLDRVELLHNKSRIVSHLEWSFFQSVFFASFCGCQKLICLHIFTHACKYNPCQVWIIACLVKHLFVHVLGKAMANVKFEFKIVFESLLRSHQRCHWMQLCVIKQSKSLRNGFGVVYYWEQLLKLYNFRLPLSNLTLVINSERVGGKSSMNCWYINRISKNMLWPISGF